MSQLILSPIVGLENRKRSVHLLHKAGARNYDVSCRSRATTAKKCTKKSDARAKLLSGQSTV